MRKLKKLLSIAMSVGMIATSTIATIPANTVSAISITFKQGDANGDGAVTVADYTLAYAHLGKSGAPVYYELISDNVAIKSVVGICTNGDDNDYSTWGVRMTPTLARFYLSNPELPENEDTE